MAGTLFGDIYNCFLWFPIGFCMANHNPSGDIVTKLGICYKCCLINTMKSSKF